MLTVGLVGCGGMGSMHLNCYLAMPDRVKVTCIAEGNTAKAEPVAGRIGAKLYASADELLENEKPDIIDICLPTFLHAKYAAMAMEKGCALFLEKPVCLTAEEADRLLEVKRRTGARVQVGHVVRFGDAYRWLKEAADAGTYGRVLSGSFERLSFLPKWAGTNLTDYRRSGTVALDMHIHDIDFVRWLMGGDPDSVSAAAVRDTEGVIEQIFAAYRYGDAVITAEGGWDFPDSFPFRAAFRVKLERATAVFDGKLTVYPADGEPFTPVFPPRFKGKADLGMNVSDMGGYYLELDRFVSDLEKGIEPLSAPMEDAVAAARIAWKEIALSGGMKI